MKTKTINYFLFIVFLFSFLSCQKEDLTSEYISESNDNLISPLKRSHSGDGKYDVLGWGCDVVQNMYAEKLPVINNDQIIANFGEGEYDGGFAPSLQNLAEYGMSAGSNALSFLQSNSKNLKIIIDGVKLFGVSLNSTLSSFSKDSSAYDSKYSYASYEVYIQKKSYRYVPTIEVLRNYLTNSFKTEIDNNFNPRNIIERYGTHVYSDVKTGGKLRFTYRAEVIGDYSMSESTKSIAASVGVSKVVENVVNKILDLDTQFTDEEKNYIIQNSKNAQYVISLTGGNSSIPIANIVMDASNTPTMNTKEWIESVMSPNISLIGFEPGSLIPIWEFVPDLDKREQLRLEVIKYFNENNFQLVEQKKDLVPVHRYYNTKTTAHYYTTWKRDISGFRYENIEFYALASSNVVKSAEPIYRYYNRKTGNHYYSAYLRPITNYVNEGAEFYAPLSQLPSTIPVYRYYNSKKNIHYLTTWNRPVNGFVNQGIEFYAY